MVRNRFHAETQRGRGAAGCPFLTRSTRRSLHLCSSASLRETYPIFAPLMNPKSSHPRARLSSFGYAFRGLVSLVRQEPNAKLHAIATMAVIAFGIYRGLE